MERNCETCSRFPNCKDCINGTEYVDKTDGRYLILYLVASIIGLGILIWILI